MNDNSDYYSSADEASNAPAVRAKPARKPAAPRPPRPKVFSCNHCQRCFDRPSLLAQHILIHTGERPHQCPKCNDKRFSRTSNLYRHMRTCKGTGTGPISGPPATGSKRKAADEQSSTGGAQYPSKHHSLRTADEDADGDEDDDSIASSPVLSVSSSIRSHPPSPLFAINEGADHGTIDGESDNRRKGAQIHRGLTPDPNWGPNPLASWKPQLESQRQAALSAHGVPSQQRRYTLPLPSATNAVQMPVSQRVAVGSSSSSSNAGVPRIFGLDSFVQANNANNELRLDGLENSASPFSSDSGGGGGADGTSFVDAKFPAAPFQLFPLRTMNNAATNNRQFDLLSPQSANTASSFPNSTPATSATRPQTDSLPPSGPSSSRNSVSSPSVAGSAVFSVSSASGRGGSSGLGDQMEVDNETTRNDLRRSSIGLGEATRMAAVADFVRTVKHPSTSSRRPGTGGQQQNPLSVQDHLRMEPSVPSSSPTRISSSSSSPYQQQPGPVSAPPKTLSTPSFSSFPPQQSKRMPTSIQTDDGMGYEVVMQYLIAEQHHQQQQQQQRSNLMTQQQSQEPFIGNGLTSTAGMNQFGLASMDHATQGAHANSNAGLGPSMSVGDGSAGDGMPTREESENMWRDFLEFNN